MKLSFLSATFSAYVNIQRRYFHHRLPKVSITKAFNTQQLGHSRWFQLSSSASQSYNYRCFYRHHHDRNQCFSSNADSTNSHGLTQQEHHDRIQLQRRNLSLSSTSRDTLHKTPGDPGSTTFPSDTDGESSSEGFPAFRLFYNDVYEVNLPPRHRFPMGKYRKVRERVQDKLGNLPLEIRKNVECDFQVSPLSTFEELSTTHDPNYISRFLEGDQTEQEQRNVGFPWSTEGVNRALSSVGGTLAAACFVCDRQRQQRKQLTESNDSSFSPPTWAAHIAGGTHHAFYDYGEGFSVFSDMAVAANVVLDRYPDVIQNKILMIDLDVHQGNGNAVLFQNETSEKNGHKSKYSDRVFTFSMHCSGNYFSQKQESDLDIELPIGCKDQAYLMTLNHWLRRFRAEHNKAVSNKDASSDQQQQQQKWKWDLIFFQAGVDILDEDRLGRMALSQSAVTRRNELVYKFASDLGIPLVICMGGGYPKRDDSWESIIEAHSDVYCGAHSYLSQLSASTNNLGK